MEEGIQKLPNTSSVVRRSLKNEIREATLPVQKESTGAGASYNEQEVCFTIGSDCAGTPFGSASEDPCGVCDVVTSLEGSD